jgi:NAD(P)-dependent dehydrogenase (short-subunit alcohol dehydrogenase family)
MTDLEFTTDENLSPEQGLIQIRADITKKQSVEELLHETLSAFNRVDILVNNAAINDKVEGHDASADVLSLENYPIEHWNKSLEVNLSGTFLCCQVIGSHMANQKRGSIINIASTYGIVAPDPSLYKRPDGTAGFFKTPAYPVSKAGVIMLTKYLAAYWGPQGVRVNSLSPGGVLNGQDENFILKYSNKTPLNRLAQPSDYQGALVFLASKASSYMSGANLVVDGGWTIW